MSLLINPRYRYLSNFVESLPKIFEDEGEYIHNGRNKIKVFNVDGLSINVKRYGIPPYFFNRIIYVLFRDPKAVRSYNYAFKLQQLNIDSPTPIAYIITRKGPLLSYCYLVTLQLNNLYQLYDIYNVKDVDDRDSILSELGKFTAKLHKLGIIHYDYTPGNILFSIKDGEPHFTLVDINRMGFKGVSYYKGCMNFSRIDLPPSMLKVIASSYAKEFHYNEYETIKLVIDSRKKRSRKGFLHLH